MQILAGLILLGVLITFHELGHFLFAKWLGVRVLVFSIGFGPKLIGFRYKETEYRISAIPLGGYVRMFGESLDVPEEEKKHSFMHQAIWRKSLIAFAGPLFNFILPVVLFFFLLVGHEQVLAPRIGTLLPDGVAMRSGLLVDDLIVSANGQKIESFSDVATIIAKSPGQEVKLGIKRTVSGQVVDRDVVVKPETKISNNPVEKGQAIGRIGIMPAIEKPMVVVNKESSFNHLGLKDFDEIISVDDQKIDSAASLSLAFDHVKNGAKITISRHPNEEKIVIDVADVKPLILPHEISYATHNIEDAALKDLVAATEKTKKVVEHEQALLQARFGVSPAKGVISEAKADSLVLSLGLHVKDRLVSLDGEPQAIPQLSHILLEDPTKPHVLGVIKADGSMAIISFVVPQKFVDHLSLDGDLLQVFGFAMADVYKPGQLLERHVGILEALRRASMQTADIALVTGKSLLMLVKNEAPASQIGGPIMLFDMAQKAAKKGLEYYLFIMCLLSVNLGLLNLLPVPALDGGHLLLFGVEAVQGKPLSEKTRVLVTQIGMALLLMLMAFALFNDISRLFR